MTEKNDDTPFSPAMRSALGAVARMKGDSVIAWAEVMNEPAQDDRQPPQSEPQQGWKPAGR